MQIVKKMHFLLRLLTQRKHIQRRNFLKCWESVKSTQNRVLGNELWVKKGKHAQKIEIVWEKS